MAEGTVLLVDDEVAFVETMQKRLLRRGLEVIPAYSGEEGLARLAELGPARVDAVILDVKMPGLDGLETLKLLKADHPLVEVIMLTGHATTQSAIEGMKRGALDYLMKPCDLEVLVGKVREAARRKREHQERILQAEAEMIALRRGD